MKRRKYISYTLIICFSAFLGHNLVPHHHHAEVYQEPIATDCPFEHGDHQGQDHDAPAAPGEHPTHCHAFNDVVFAKYTAPNIRPWTEQPLNLMVPGQAPRAEMKAWITHAFSPLKLPLHSHTEIGSRALRAPPAWA